MVTNNKRKAIYDGNLFVKTKPYFYNEIEVSN